MLLKTLAPYPGQGMQKQKSFICTVGREYSDHSMIDGSVPFATFTIPLSLCHDKFIHVNSIRAFRLQQYIIISRKMILLPNGS